jgi:membrane protein implicated in regulation of membrane protease activity
MYAGAAVAGFLFLLFASVALWWALGNLLDSRGWAAVIVAVIWAIVAGILAAVAKKALEETKGLPKTADTVGKIPNALKGQEENNR